ncbi:MAG: hypothetical protein LBL00_09305, partial [Endomicrobium sp.]|nr:hypothetical protein [Endomicrobium sp.]
MLNGYSIRKAAEFEFLDKQGKPFPINSVYIYKGMFAAEAAKNARKFYPNFPAINLERYGLANPNGGMIILGTDVNTTAKQGLIGWLQAKYQTVKNRLFSNEKIKDKI